LNSADQIRDEVRRRILGAVRRACPPWLASQAEDITQEAMLRLHQVLEKQGERDRPVPSSYLMKTAYSVVFDTMRRLRQQRLHESGTEDGVVDGATGSLSNPEHQAHAGEVARGIEECLEQLTPGRRTAVTCYLHGHTIRETAQLAGWAVTRANNLIYRGLQAMRDCLRGKGIEP